MANPITVVINDKRKSAVCKETVALCGKYAVTVNPPLVGNGKLVLHRKHALYAPNGSQVSIGGVAIQVGSDKWDANEVYAVIDLTTTTVGTVTTTTGTLDLSFETLVRDMIGKYGINSEVPLDYAIYDLGAEGMAGSGEFNLKVIEPYYVTQNQSLVLFKGDKGDDGDDGEDGLTPTINATNKHWFIGSTDTGIVAEGKDGNSPHVGQNGHWYVGDTDTGIEAHGHDGSVCTIDPTTKHWKIDGVDTGIVAEGKAGSVCTIRQSDKHWLIDGVDTGVVAKGETTVLDGSYIYNNATHKWHQMFVYTDPETGDKTVFVSDTGVDSRPEVTVPRCTVTKVGGTVTITCVDNEGTTTSTVNDGVSPHIDAITGNWFIGTTDTGVHAKGDKGDTGTSPHIGANGHWYVGTTDTGINAKGDKGDDGDDGTSASASVTQSAVDANGNRTTTITCQTGTQTPTTATIVSPKIVVCTSLPSPTEAGTVYFVLES